MASVATPTAPTQRKPRPKPQRVLRVVEPATPDTDSWLAAEIVVGKKSDTYIIGPIPCELGEGLLGYEVEKVATDPADDNLATPYHCIIDTRGDCHTCDCMGCERHGHCKHIDSLLALRRNGLLHDLQTAREARRNTELHYAPAEDCGYSQQAEEAWYQQQDAEAEFATTGWDAEPLVAATDDCPF